MRTLGRVAAHLAPEDLQEGSDAFTARVTLTRLPAPSSTSVERLHAVAMDLKAIAGARTSTTTAPFLVAVVTHATASSAPIVLSQQAVSTTSATTKTGKAGRAPTGQDLVTRMALTGCVPTADAGHTYAATAAAIRAAGGHYLLVIEGNQPNPLGYATHVLSELEKDYPSSALDGAPRPVDGPVGQGPREQRHLRAATVDPAQLRPFGVTFPRYRPSRPADPAAPPGPCRR